MGKKKKEEDTEVNEVSSGLALFILSMFMGWFINLVLVIKLAFTGITLGTLTVFNFFQIIGVFVAPLGSILGFVGLF
jgi:hypothetical protein